MSRVLRFLGFSALVHAAWLGAAGAQTVGLMPPAPQTFLPVVTNPGAMPPVPAPAVPAPADASRKPVAAPPRLAQPRAPAPAGQAQIDPAPGTPSLAPAERPSPIDAPVAQPAPAKPKPVAAAPKALESALPTDPYPAFSPDSLMASQIASDRYANIALAGGWPTIAAPLKPGARGQDVAVLRQRLSIEGDLEGYAAAPDVWDEGLTQAVKRFQNRMGLRQTGVVAGATLKAMNVPAEQRAHQLAASLQRMQTYQFPFGDRYVVVNLPSATVEAVENGRVAHRYVAVVGDVKHRSPEVVARVQAVNLNPTWTVPTSIIKNEIIPKMRKDPGYLGRQKIRMLDSKGSEVDPRAIDWSNNSAVTYTLRQDSGASNALGNIRINMPNRDAVYMHDTPSKRYFGADYRFLSHGCVRVAGVFDFAQWILEGTSGPGNGWDKSAMLAKVNTKERTDIRVTRSVPVIWTYMTGWADSSGTAHFRDDVYGYDAPAVLQARADRALATR